MCLMRRTFARMTCPLPNFRAPSDTSLTRNKTATANDVTVQCIMGDVCWQSRWAYPQSLQWCDYRTLDYVAMAKSNASEWNDSYFNLPSFITRKPLKPRIDWLGFEGQHAEDAFVNSAQWFTAHEAFESLDAQCELS